MRLLITAWYLMAVAALVGGLALAAYSNNVLALAAGIGGALVAATVGQVLSLLDRLLDPSRVIYVRSSAPKPVAPRAEKVS